MKLTIHILLVFLFSASALAVEESDGAGSGADSSSSQGSGADSVSSCLEAMSGGKPMGAATTNFIVVPSDRVPSESAKFESYVNELVGPDGILEKLDLYMTGQIVEFLQGRDLNAVTSGSAGGYPVSHYLDGAAVIEALKPKGGFALEVVYPGDNFQHGFYRDDNDEDSQISILDHVVGHNTFAYYSVFQHYRAGQGLLATRKLDDLLRRLYVNFDKDDVQRFYLWALTLAPLMDYYSPHYQGSKEFEPAFNPAFDPLGRSPRMQTRHPAKPTENILAAFAANISPHDAPWKREILDYIESAMAFRPALVHTQIMNEGWCTLLQQLFPQYRKERHHLPYWLNAAGVMQPEHQPNIRDPYSLGIAVWLNIKARFQRQPEIASLPTQLEKDRLFLRYAVNEIIGKMDDSQFLLFGIDQPLVDKYKWAVVRRAEKHEEDPNLPPPPRDDEPKAQWILVSKNARDVAHSIINSVVKPKYQWRPRVKLVDFNRPGSGEVQLVIDDEFGNELAIEKTTLAPALYAMAKIIGKTVSLESNITHVSFASPDEEEMYYTYKKQGFTPPWIKPAVRLVRARTIVSENGEVRVFIKDENGHEALDADLTRTVAKHFGAYMDDLYLEDNEELGEIIKSSQTLQELNTQMIAESIDDTAYEGVVAHAPNTPGAIVEYKTMLERRLHKALERGMKKGGVRIVNGAARVKALPSVVTLEFDREWAEQVIKNAPKHPVNYRTLLAINHLAKNHAPDTFAALDDGGRVGGPIGGQPGDRFWGPGDGGGGGTGTDPGEDPNDPSWVDVPSDLYAQYLGERVRLPILNRKPGESKAPAKKAGKRISRTWGAPLAMPIAENAMRRGIGKAIEQGEDPSLDPRATLMNGFRNLHPRDWMVRNVKDAKKPDTKAVVTFVLDLSGSTMRYMESFKRFVFDIQTLIKSNYKGFDFRYVVFDTKAHVLKDEKAFFRSKLGGGTMYYTGIKKTHELFNEEYPRSQWDRYTFLMGDMEDGRPDEAFVSIQDLLLESEFFGTVAGLNGDMSSPWLKLLHTLVAETPNNPALGLTILGPDASYGIENIREVLKNTDDE